MCATLRTVEVEDPEDVQKPRDLLRPVEAVPAESAANLGEAHIPAALAIHVGRRRQAFKRSSYASITVICSHSIRLNPYQTTTIPPT
jgi:hypothetical protein